MAEPFKNLLNPALVLRTSAHLARAWPQFQRTRFEEQALDGLEALEMKQRTLQICAALEATLPADFHAAAALIEAVLAPPVAVEGMASHDISDRGLAGWILWPMGEFVARRGLPHAERALQALHAITQRFTAEWAIRPFITHHPALALATLQRWTADPSEHVRRLASEGSRPRLPWGEQLKALVADPRPTLPILLALQDDPSEYVRRSVANHLNDIAKDHPALVAQWLRQHLPQASPQRRALLRHASRTLIKDGHAEVMALWGLGAPLRGRCSFVLSPKRVKVGGSLDLALTLRSSAAQAQALEIDYVVHHVKADGRRTPKVFKGWRVTLPARGELTLSKQHSMREVTTRRYHAGEHRVEMRINGRSEAEAAFALQLSG